MGYMQVQLRSTDERSPPGRATGAVVTFVVAKEMWIYVAATLPLLLLTIGVYVVYERKAQREQKPFSRD